MAIIATEGDLEAAIATLVAAFDRDPLWSWICPDPERRAAQHELIFGLYAESALSAGGVWMTDASASAAMLFTHPGERELSESGEEKLGIVVREELGNHAPAVLETMARFEQAIPEGPPFYYVSFLGTRPDRRGQGIGMGLLAELAGLADQEGRPIYLESTNPANNQRYERLGFDAQSRFSTPDELHSVTTMWREPAAGA